MMVKKLTYRRSDGEFLEGGGFEPDINIEDPANPGETMLDPARGIAELDRVPDMRREKYDEASGQIVLKTQAEIDAFDAAGSEAEAAAYTDATGAAAENRKIFKAAFIEYHAELEAIAGILAGYTAPALGDFRKRVIDRYKGL